MSSETTEQPDDAARVGQLRGAGVASVDAHRLLLVVVGICLAGLVVGAVAFTVAGAHHNAQLDALHDDGTPVVVVVSSCGAQLGGSGSNAAGYVCRGTFTLGAHRYNDLIPGTADHPQGAALHAVVVRSDPSLLATASQLTTEHASTGVYLLPAVLAGLALVLAAVLFVMVRRRRDGKTDTDVDLTGAAAVDPSVPVAPASR